jgi:DNA invertase Pin-like site-specific DNA recombinase
MLRCAIYTRKSSDHGLDQDFNSLDAQHEAAEAYIKSQAHEGWKLIKTHYDDGGLPGGTIERPALQSLLSGLRERKIDIVVVYKLDRLTPRIRQQPVAIAARRSEVHFRSITCHCANASERAFGVPSKWLRMNPSSSAN